MPGARPSRTKNKLRVILVDSPPDRPHAGTGGIVPTLRIGAERLRASWRHAIRPRSDELSSDVSAVAEASESVTPGRAERVRCFVETDLLETYLHNLRRVSESPTGHEPLAGRYASSLAIDYLRDRTVDEEERGRRRRRWRAIVLAAFALTLGCIDGYENPCGCTKSIMICACAAATTRHLAENELAPMLAFCDWRPCPTARSLSIDAGKLPPTPMATPRIRRMRCLSLKEASVPPDAPERA